MVAMSNSSRKKDRLIEGGQGRSGADLESEGSAIGAIVIFLLIMAFVAECVR
jgi:hypothetical protein